MLTNPVKTKMSQGKPSYGVMIPWFCPNLVEFFGHLGFEWVFIDAEHGSIGRESCESLVRASNLVGMMPVVRVPENNPATILAYLEAGAMGIIVPHINTADDARAAVDAIRYAPLGRRGAGSGTAPANYGLTQTASEYFASANEALLVNVLVEEIEGVQNLDEILAVEGVDAAGIGPGDLAMSMGFPGQANHPEVRKLVGEAESRIVRAGKILDAVITDATSACTAVELGARMIAVSSTALLGSAGRDYLDQVKQESSHG
jgi:2-keto-3-deoxy-L-rhamnonate aldolase RhmA